MASLSGRYTGGAETIMEEDLGRIRDIREASAPSWRSWRRRWRASSRTDFWEITPPRGLETSSVNSPAARAYLAARDQARSPHPFSPIRRIADLYDPAIHATRKAIEGHHLFPAIGSDPRAFTTSKHRVNQAANLARVEWPGQRRRQRLRSIGIRPRLRAMFSPRSLGRDVWLPRATAGLGGDVVRGISP